MITNKVIDMRVEAAILRAENVQLKLEGRRKLKQARRQASNQDSARAKLSYAAFNNLYNERMQSRSESRYHHLARMLLKGRRYIEVEQSTHERVNPERLYDTVWQWEPAVNYNLVESWLDTEV